MRKVNLVLAIMLLTGLIFSCSTDAGVDVTITWEDNEYFSSDADCYCAIALGTYSFADGTFENDAFDQEAVTPGTDASASFSTTLSGIAPAEGIVVFIYYDNDGNGEYGDGDNLNNYKDDVLDSDGLEIELTPYY